MSKSVLAMVAAISVVAGIAFGALDALYALLTLWTLGTSRTGVSGISLRPLCALNTLLTLWPGGPRVTFWALCSSSTGCPSRTGFALYALRPLRTRGASFSGGSLLTSIPFLRDYRPIRTFGRRLPC